MSEKTQYEAACDHTNILEPNSLRCYDILDGSGTTDFLSVFFLVMVFVKKLRKFLKNPYEFLKENHMNLKKKTI